MNLTSKTLLLFIWAFASCIHAKPDRIVSAGGRLILRNASSEPVEVFAEGSLVARVPAGEEVLAEHLPIGSCRVEAIGQITGTTAATVLTIEDNKTLSWRIEETEEQRKALAPLWRGKIRVLNLASEPIRIFIDGGAQEMIWPGAQAEYGGLKFGNRHLRAVGVKSGFVVDQEVAVLEGVTPFVVVSRPNGAIEVSNRSAKKAIVTVGNKVVRVEPGAAGLVPDLPPEKVAVVARDDMFRPLFDGEVTVSPGEVARVTIPEPGGALAVVSDLEEPVTVLYEGRPLGLCPARGAAEFKGLAPGLARVQAINSTGQTLARARISIPKDGQGVWMLKPGMVESAGFEQGALLVKNKSREPLLLRVDGYDRGRIEPGSRRIVSSLLSGPHLVETLGLRTRHIFRSVAEVAADSTTALEVPPPIATLVVRNLREEPVRLIMHDKEVASLAPSESKEVRVPAGRLLLEARGVTSFKSTLHDLTLPAAAVYSLDLARPYATIVITNRFADPIEVRANERELGVLGSGEKAAFKDLEPGTIRLTARSITRPLVWSLTIVLGPGETYEWEISP